MFFTFFLHKREASSILVYGRPHRVCPCCFVGVLFHVASVSSALTAYFIPMSRPWPFPCFLLLSVFPVGVCACVSFLLYLPVTWILFTHVSVYNQFISRHQQLIASSFHITAVAHVFLTHQSEQNEHTQDVWELSLEHTSSYIDIVCFSFAALVLARLSTRGR